jgi:mono/diheme cytochrome c family protein
MHHVYTRRIVIALVGFFAVLALLFGPLVTALRTAPEATAATAATSSGATAADGLAPTGDGEGGGTGITLPNGQAAFDNLCASCHKAEKFADKLRNSLDPDAASLAQLEKLVAPPAHGGASPAEALAIVIKVRSLAGLSSTYPPGVATPAAAATAAAALPTPTAIPPENLLTDYQGVWEQQCATCHRADKFAAGLKAEADPDLRTWQAVEYLSGPPAHYNRPVVTFLPAMNYVRELSGLVPLAKE